MVAYWRSSDSRKVGSRERVLDKSKAAMWNNRDADHNILYSANAN